MTKEKAREIVKNLNQTLSKMGDNDGLHSANSMFKMPRAKRSDLIKKRNEIIKQNKL
tara:strand:+ start:207 stop:377 length:171 start_codon:yes stop_codon:yes gene_type:complete